MSRSSDSSKGPFVVLGGVLLISAMLCCAGCTNSAGPGPSAAGSKVMLDSEPTDPMGVVDLKSAMITGIGSMDGSTSIVGKVVSGQDWELDQAMFLVRDLESGSTHDHGDGDHSDCAFCQAKEKETGSMALVRIVDAEGKTIGADARKLLGLEEDAVIVAQGGGTIDEDGTLVFAANKIFIRR